MFYRGISTPKRRGEERKDAKKKKCVRAKQNDTRASVIADDIATIMFKERI